ncbi:MAG: hypothetical protein E7326_06030 [Clostridiales bacterium]|nr:hypothetical protein [Clostridiales bacterium]
MPQMLLLLLAGALIFLCFLPRPDAGRLRPFSHFPPFAHRGLHGKHAPENSLTAFEHAKASGFGTELDVRITRDLVPVVFHDADLLRMCGTDQRVEDTEYADLCRLRLSRSEEGIPTLLDALKELSPSPVMIEVKPPKQKAQTRMLVKAVADAAGSYPGSILLVSFSPRILRMLKKLSPHAPRGQLVARGKGMALYLALCPFIHLYARPHFLSCDIGCRAFSIKIARLFHPVLAGWTVRSTEEWQAVEHIFDLKVFEAFLPQADACAAHFRKRGILP